MDKLKEWLEQVTKSGNLCEQYQNKAERTMSLKAYFDFATDANGASFIPEMQSKGFILPYEYICEHFSSFINGKYVSVHHNHDRSEYTTEVYCCHRGQINARTTILTLLGCNCIVKPEKHAVITIYADKNTTLTIDDNESLEVKVEYWGEKPIVNGDGHNVKLKKRD